MRSVGAIFWLLLCVAAADGARADTIKDALGHAYLAHPQINAQRADTRSVDENLPIADRVVFADRHRAGKLWSAAARYSRRRTASRAR